jgi:hypothetical protein
LGLWLTPSVQTEENKLQYDRARQAAARVRNHSKRTCSCSEQIPILQEQLKAAQLALAKMQNEPVVTLPEPPAPWQSATSFAPDTMSRFMRWLVGMYPGFKLRHQDAATLPTLPTGVPEKAILPVETTGPDGEVTYEVAEVDSTEFTAACTAGLLPSDHLALELALSWAESRPESLYFRCFHGPEEHTSAGAQLVRCQLQARSYFTLLQVFVHRILLMATCMQASTTALLAEKQFARTVFQCVATAVLGLVCRVQTSGAQNSVIKRHQELSRTSGSSDYFLLKFELVVYAAPDSFY